MKRLLFSFVILSAICCTSFTYIPSDIAPTEEKWKLKYDKNGIKIYLRKKDGLAETKTVTSFTNTSMHSIVALIDDYKNHVNWMEGISKATLKKQLSPKAKYMHYVIPVPWPLRNRDIVSHAYFKEKGNQLWFITNSKPKLYPNKKYTRIEKSFSTWTFTKKGNKIDLVYIVKNDTGGIPQSFISSMLVSAPRKTIVNIKKQIKLPKYKNAKLKWLKMK